MTHLSQLLLLMPWLSIEAGNFGISLMKIQHYDTTQIVCTIALLKKYFLSAEALSGSVLHMSITSAPNQLQQSLLSAMHANPFYHHWTIVIKNIHSGNWMEMDLNSQHVLQEKPQTYFFVIENIENEEVDDIFESLKANLNWNPLAQFVVYYSALEDTEEVMADIIIEIFMNFMNNKIYSVNVIGKSEESKSYFGKTVFPYHPDNNCGNRVVSVETLDVCEYREPKREKGSQEVETAEEDTESKGEQPRKRFAEETIFESHSVRDTQTSLVYTNQLLQHDYALLHIKELYSTSFFDKFPKDLNGCPLVAAYRAWEPYIFNEALDNSLYTISMENTANNQTYGKVNDTDSDSYGYVLYKEEQDVDNGAEVASSEIHLNGIEYKMLQTIAERLHISIEMQVENNNLYHLFQKLIDGDIEMVIGGIDEDPSISQFVSSTIPYYQDDLTWCVAKAQHAHNLYNFVSIFQIGVWWLTLLFILAASLYICVAQHCLKLPLGFLKCYVRTNVYVMGIILNQAINLRPIPTSLKLCFGTTFFMSIMFSNIYKSFLVSTLTTPKTSYQISQLEQIYENRLHIMGSVENVRHLNKEGEIYRYVREQFKMCYNIEECLEQAANDTKLAVIVSRQHSIYNPRIPRNKLYCFDRNENIYVYLVTMLMPKKFHLLHKINPVIQHIIESGHIYKWARDLDLRRNINEEMPDAPEKQFQSLTLSQVAGSFVLSGFLLAFASWMFLIECTVYWLAVKRRSTFKSIKYLHWKLF